MCKVFCTAVMITAIFQMAFSQGGPVINLGAGRSFDKLLAYTWNVKDSLFYIGSDPNGHLFSYIPFSDSLHDLGKTRESNNNTEENYVWTLCSDDNGVVYGGTCQTPPAYIFAYDPALGNLGRKELSYPQVSFIWCSVATDSFVYFGTEGGGRGRLLKWDKNINHSPYDVFESLRYPQDSLPLSRNFVFGHCSSELQSFLIAHSDSNIYRGETMVRSLTVGPQGKIYGGTGKGFVFV